MNQDRSQPVDRRQAMGAIAAGVAFAGLATSPCQAEAAPLEKTTLGLVIYDCALRRKMLAEQDAKVDLFEPLTFLKHCQSVGAGGMQANLGVLKAEQVRDLRKYADEHQLFIDGIVNPPKDEADLDRFTAEIKSCAEIGALAVRTV